MRFLTLEEVLHLHDQVIQQSGGAQGLRDLGALEAAVAQPRMSFGGEELYPTIAAKAAALCYSLVKNHPFLDGNKRIGHAAMETYLVLNGFEIEATVEDQERCILALAAGELERSDLLAWLEAHLVPR